MKKFSILLISLMLVLALMSCGENGSIEDKEKDGPASNEDIAITINISYPDESNLDDVEDAAMIVEDKSSVLEALTTYADENGIEVEMDESSENPYVTSINGVAESDTAGWIYEVNNETVMESADMYILENGDVISWFFESWAQ